MFGQKEIKTTHKLHMLTFPVPKQPLNSCVHVTFFTILKYSMHVFF